MSNENNPETKFKLVTHKKGRKTMRLPKIATPSNSGEDLLNKDALLRRVLEAKSEIKSSDLLASALASLREGIETLSSPEIKEIICFGLGRIGECMISRYQFAFLLCLKEVYNVTVKVYDPLFAPTDCWLLQQLDCTVLEENFEGKYKIQDKHTRIFYMPHCPKQLTNNLLWVNWGLDLNYCVIIANSFNAIVENTPNRELNVSGEYIVKIVPHMVELALINSFRFYEIFNDTAIHIFPWNKIQLLSDDFWLLHDEPNYSDEVEFIRNKLVPTTP